MRAHVIELWGEGELESCTICRGAEGSLPTECPGRKMSRAEDQRVYTGVLDFVGGRWVSKGRRGVVIRMTQQPMPGANQSFMAGALDPWTDWLHRRLEVRGESMETQDRRWRSALMDRFQAERESA